MSVTSLYVIHKREFEPIVRIEEAVRLVAERDIYARVVYIEPIQPLIIDLGPIGAATPTLWPAPGSSRELSELELGESEFGQWRIAPLDDILLEVRLPAAIARFVRRAGATPVSRLSISRDQFTEIFTLRRLAVPTVVPYNPNFYPLDMARILVAGYRYVFEHLESAPEKYTTIPIHGFATTTR